MERMELSQADLEPSQGCFGLTEDDIYSYHLILFSHPHDIHLAWSRTPRDGSITHTIFSSLEENGVGDGFITALVVVRLVPDRCRVSFQPIRAERAYTEKEARRAELSSRSFSQTVILVLCFVICEESEAFLEERRT